MCWAELTHSEHGRQRQTVDFNFQVGKIITSENNYLIPGSVALIGCNQAYHCNNMVMYQGNNPESKLLHMFTQTFEIKPSPSFSKRRWAREEKWIMNNKPNGTLLACELVQSQKW